MKRVVKFYVIIAVSVGILFGESSPIAAEEINVSEETDITENSGDPSEETDTEDNPSEEPVWETPKLKAASRPGGKIKISWSEPDGATEYVLYRSTAKTEGFKKIYKTQTEDSYLDEKRVPGKKYYYRIRVYYEESTEFLDSKVVSARSLKQAEITGISNTSGSRKLVLSWKPVKGAEDYQILRKNQSTAAYEEIASVEGTMTSYTDTKRSGGKVYSYKVCAVDANGGKGSRSEKASQMAIDKNKKMIAITYDDGPSIYTPTVLDALEKYEAHATFFVVGNRVDQYGSYIRREVNLGCEIGNHTYGHNSLSGLSSSQIQSVLSKTSKAVKKQAGVDIHIMRPPGGGYNSNVCKASSMPLIIWSVDTQDWKTRSTSATIQCVKQKSFDGAIVLMHDIHKPTVQAADTVIRQLKEDGYQLVTVSEMAAYRGGMKDGKVYFKFKK